MNLTRSHIRNLSLSNKGVALVITLIMLSVITFLAVAFLALSRRERASMTTAQSQTDSRLMADAALARAQAEIMARIVSQKNPFAYDLMVSRNFFNPNGFDPAGALWDTNNVNYDYTLGGVGALNNNERIYNIANLYYDPRPPVYVKTNTVGPADFRFYLDFNRNGRFDTNGLQPVVIDEAGNTNGTQFLVGDPEWIGVLEKPELPHSPTNRFVGRYAYLVMPEGKQLDVNFIHNYAKGTTNNAYSSAMPFVPGDGFLRNQGFGSWELSLSGFLQNLNTNIYGTNIYLYRTNVTQAHSGHAFEDAFDILRYRYATNHSTPNLKSAELTLGLPAATEFKGDLVDGYANGPLLTTISNFAPESDMPDRPWAGSRNPQRYTDIQELFDPNKTSQLFVDRLRGAMEKTNSYDRNTYYRLLSQIGTHSTPDNTFRAGGREHKKVHINYDNFTPNTDNLISQTNFFEWTPSNFFFHAAEALIHKGLAWTNTQAFLGGMQVRTNLSVTNIQIYPRNEYTPALHRLFQLAANIYAATTNGYSTNVSGVGVTNLPFVFRPIFSKEGTNVFITGYSEETSTNIGPFFDIETYATSTAIPTNALATNNIYGVPWVISAKEHLPNFNEFAMDTVFQLTRKLELKKKYTNYPPEGTTPSGVNTAYTNQMYVATITNFMGAEFWNSSTQTYNRPIRVLLTNIYMATITNEFGTNIWSKTFTNFVNPQVRTFWPGATPYTDATVNPQSFFLPVNMPWTIAFLPESQYKNWPNANTISNFIPTSLPNVYFETNKPFYVPDWTLRVTNRLFCALQDVASGRTIDFVSLDNLLFSVNLTTNLYNPSSDDLGVSAVWNTNRGAGAPVTVRTDGIQVQVNISRGFGGLDLQDLFWRNASRTPRKESEIDKFKKYMQPNASGLGNIKDTNRVQAPFNPTATLLFRRSWQANDPLVHYIGNDLQPPALNRSHDNWRPDRGYTIEEDSNLLKINERYEPWGGNRIIGRDETVGSGEFLFEASMKDPMVRWSDDWDFPTNKFPSIGWLGRVHRGTPWQTVYLKSAVAKVDDWANKWAGSAETHPTNDWPLLDVFTVAPNDNAARGLLSVNQAGLAGWSAALSAVIVLSNSVPNNDVPTYDPHVIDPLETNLTFIVNSINANRADTNRYPTQSFSSLGQVLCVPELTFNSPYLNFHPTDVLIAEKQRQKTPEAVYERIPQQILSLLRTDRSRISVYSFGQALKPAEKSIVLNPPDSALFNICTNYQITAEVWTRSVVRIDERIDYNVTPPTPPKTNYQAVVESFTILE
jgi:hypothetical protein